MTDYLKIPEIARRLDVSEPTARRMVKSGKLPSVFVGGAYRVNEDDLANYLDEARVRPGEQRPKAQAPLPFENAGERGEEQRRYEQLDDDKLFMFLGYHTHHLKDQAKASRDFFAYLKRHPEGRNWNSIDRLFGGASWDFRNRVTRDTTIFSDAERILAASEAGEVVPDHLKTRAEEFMAAFRDLDVVVEEFAQTKALLQGYELGPGDPAGIFAHSRGPRSVDYADSYGEAWAAEQAEQREVPVKDHDA